MIEKVGARPPWVRDAIFELRAEAERVEDQRVRLEDVARKMKARGINTGELADASHELEHVWKHLTSARRALVMVWPAEDE